MSDSVVARAYRDIARTHGWLGDTDYVVRTIRRNPLLVRRIVDVGCATGLVLKEVQPRLG